MSWPFERESVDPELNALSERPSREPIRVLLVEDDPTFRDLGVGTLERRTGFSVAAVRTPREALDGLRERPVDRSRGNGSGDASAARAIEWFCR